MIGRHRLIIHFRVVRGGTVVPSPLCMIWVEFERLSTLPLFSYTQFIHTSYLIKFIKRGETVIKLLGEYVPRDNYSRLWLYFYLSIRSAATLQSTIRTVSFGCRPIITVAYWGGVFVWFSSAVVQLCSCAIVQSCSCAVAWF